MLIFLAIVAANEIKVRELGKEEQQFTEDEFQPDEIKLTVPELFLYLKEVEQPFYRQNQFRSITTGSRRH